MIMSSAYLVIVKVLKDRSYGEQKSCTMRISQRCHDLALQPLLFKI
jgi:hypothetical protein